MKNEIEKQFAINYDYILKQYLNVTRTQGIYQNEIWNIIERTRGDNLKNVTYNDFYKLVDKLFKDGNLETAQSGYSISDKGKIFIAGGGYETELDKSNKAAKIDRLTKLFDFISKPATLFLAIATITWNVYSSVSTESTKDKLMQSTELINKRMTELDMLNKKQSETIEQLRIELDSRAATDTTDK